MKKINVLHTTLFLGMGGLESIILDICRNINKEKFQLHVLCLSAYDEKYKKILDENNVVFHYLKREGTFDYKFFIKYIDIIKKNKIHIVHAHSGCFFNASICSALAGVKGFVYTEHGMPFFDDGQPINSGLKTVIEDKIAAALSDRIFAVSDEIKTDMIVNRFPKFRNKVKTISNGIDTEKFMPFDKSIRKSIKNDLSLPENKIVIGTVGRFVPIKNHKCLIDSFSKLDQEFENQLHLVLVGDGVLRPELEEKVWTLNLQGKISFTGVQYNIQTILQSFDIFVLPSLTEGTSISLLEAQSCGIPAVVTDVGGNPKIVENGKNGFLCKVDDEDDLKEKISLFLENKGLIDTAGENARSIVCERFSLDSMIKQYEKSYVELIQKEK